MRENEIWTILEEGGFRAIMRNGVPIFEKYSGLNDPSGAERLGHLLAKAVSDLSPSLVLVWEEPEDVVLGFFVALELDVRVKRVMNAEGLAEHEGELPAGSRAILVADAFREVHPLLAVSSLLDRQEATLVAAAALVDTGRVALPVPLRSLVKVQLDQPANGDS